MAQYTESPKAAAFRFLQTNKSAALATVSSSGTPHVATIYYLSDNRLNLYLVIGVESRKYQNLILNTDVAMAISEDGPIVRKTLQLSGIISRINNINEEQRIIEQLCRKNGRNSSMPFLIIYNRRLSDELAVMKVVPYEMTLAKYSNRDVDLNKEIFISVIKRRKTQAHNQRSGY